MFVIVLIYLSLQVPNLVLFIFPKSSSDLGDQLPEHPAEGGDEASDGEEERDPREWD